MLSLILFLNLKIRDRMIKYFQTSRSNFSSMLFQSQNNNNLNISCQLFKLKNTATVLNVRKPRL